MFVTAARNEEFERGSMGEQKM